MWPPQQEVEPDALGAQRHLDLFQTRRSLQFKNVRLSVPPAEPLDVGLQPFNGALERAHTGGPRGLAYLSRSEVPFAAPQGVGLLLKVYRLSGECLPLCNELFRQLRDAAVRCPTLTITPTTPTDTTSSTTTSATTISTTACTTTSNTIFTTVAAAIVRSASVAIQGKVTQPCLGELRTNHRLVPGRLACPHVAGHRAVMLGRVLQLLPEVGGEKRLLGQKRLLGNIGASCVQTCVCELCVSCQVQVQVQ